MNVSTTIPPTVQIQRGRLLGLVVGVTVLAAAVAWAVTAYILDTGSQQAQKSVSARPAVVSLAIPATGPKAITSRAPVVSAIPPAGFMEAITALRTPAVVAIPPAGFIEAINSLRKGK